MSFTKRIFRISGVIFFGLLAIIALGATLIPIIPSKEWYVQIFDYPRLQTFFIAVVVLCWYVTFYFKGSKRDKFFAAGLVGVIMIQAYKAAPYTPMGKKQVLEAATKVNDSNTISLFICNVLQTNTSYDKVLEKMQQYQPDVIITTETDTIWQRHLKPLKKTHPYRQPVPLSNLYGMHLYSKLPLSQVQVRYLVEADIPSIRANVQLRSGVWITLFIIHPRPPVPGESNDSRERDAEIIMVGKEARKEKGGVIVAGDFNDVAWSENTRLFQEVTGYLDPRRGRGFYNTYHAKMPIFRWPLDHIFHSNHFKVVKIKRLGNVGSDHFPMFIHLQYAPADKPVQRPVEPDKNTEKDANETIREAKNDLDGGGK